MRERPSRHNNLGRGWLVGELDDANLEDDIAQLNNRLQEPTNRPKKNSSSCITGFSTNQIRTSALKAIRPLNQRVGLSRFFRQGAGQIGNLGQQFVPVSLLANRGLAYGVFAVLLAAIVTFGVIIRPPRATGDPALAQHEAETQVAADIYGRSGSGLESSRGERATDYSDTELNAMFQAEGRVRDAVRQAAQDLANQPSQNSAATTTEEATAPAGSTTEATAVSEQKPQSAIQAYTVQEGDTVSGIATQFGISVDTIRWANGLDEQAMIQPGDQLVIPPTTGVVYTVADGDTLSGIANSFGLSSSDVAQFNGLSNVDAIQPGMTLVLPGAAAAEPTPAPDPTEAPVQVAEAPPTEEPATEAPAAGEPAPAEEPTKEPAPQPKPASDPKPAVSKPVPAEAPTEVPTEEPTPESKSGDLGQQIADYGLKFLGTPYVWGGTSPSGFDCSGFVYYVYRHFGIGVPRTVEGLAGAGPRISRDNLQPGDVLLFANTYKSGLSHTGIYIGNGNFVHAVTFGVPLKVDSLGSSYYTAHYYGAVRPW